MFSSMKTEEYMESELFAIFQVKLVAKNIEHFLLWVSRDPFHAVKLQKYIMYMRVNQSFSYASFLTSLPTVFIMVLLLADLCTNCDEKHRNI